MHARRTQNIGQVARHKGLVTRSNPTSAASFRLSPRPTIKSPEPSVHPVARNPTNIAIAKAGKFINALPTRCEARRPCISFLPMYPIRSSLRSVSGLFAVGWFLLCLSAVRLGAVEITEGPTVDVSPTHAVVRWTTDVPAGTRVHFGLATTTLTSRAEGEVGTAHVATLPGLRPDTIYHFAVGTARYALATNSFATPGLSAAAGTPATLTPPKPADTIATVKAAAPARPRPPPTRATWAGVASLPDHFARHGADFHAQDADDYAAQAWLFLQRAKTDGLPAKRDDDGVLRVFDPKSGAFAAYNRDGKTKTYFKPGRRGYFDDQPGTGIDLRKTR